MWTASSPGELRGQVTLAAGQYTLTDLDGSITRFDAATGKWLSTADRWGNALTSSYDGVGNPAGLADGEGRPLSLAYDAGHLSTITLPDGELLRFAYDGSGNLAAIFDPLHTGATLWRTFAYAADSRRRSPAPTMSSALRRAFPRPKRARIGERKLWSASLVQGAREAFRTVGLEPDQRLRAQRRKR